MRIVVAACAIAILAVHPQVVLGFIITVAALTAVGFAGAWTIVRIDQSRSPNPCAGDDRDPVWNRTSC